MASIMLSGIAISPTFAYLRKYPQSSVTIRFGMSQVISDFQTKLRSWQSIAGMIDHTLLKPEATRDQITRLCQEAAFFKFAAVCVNPCWISLAVNVLRGTPVKTATTVGFPLGAN